MPSITVTDGYTFNNWGPLTTTFTAPASCATGTGNYRIGVNTTFPFFQFAAQCSTVGFGDCLPTGTVSQPTTLDLNPNTMYDQAFYSPGLDCPSGWATVGAAARGNDKSLTWSGILSRPSPTTTHTGPTFSGPISIATLQNPVSLLAELLDPNETLAMCCPSSMTANLAYGCYSTVSDYEVTTGCMSLLPQEDFGTATKTYTVDGTTSQDLIFTFTASHPMSIATTTFPPSQRNRLVGVSVVSMVPLVHHQSDIRATETAVDGSTNATTTSNSAAIVAPKTSTWKGLGGVLGVSFAAITLGAALVL